MPTPATKSTSRSTAAKTPSRDAIVLLKADHADVKKMYRQYEKLVDSEADAATRGALAAQICHALTAHATAEEELFYPAAREALADDEMVDHADVEHACAKELIAQIEAMHPDDSHYDAKVVVLCEYVAHHVKEEETELFPACRASRKMDLKGLGAAIAARKAELLATLKAEHASHANGIHIPRPTSKAQRPAA